MKNQIKYEIDKDVLTDYITALNQVSMPMSRLKNNLEQTNEEKKNLEYYKENLTNLLKVLKTMLDNNPLDKMNIYIDVISQLLNTNNGILQTRMIEPLNISRQYLTLLEKQKKIEKIERGIYISTETMVDSYYILQLRYKKIIFSHMNALYFYNMTEEFPSIYTVTVPRDYHVEKLNEDCNVFYIDKKLYNLGVSEVKTPNGNKVKAYDVERCVCDIIRSKNRIDPEQLKKALKNYAKWKDKNLVKLSKYAKEMGIGEEVMEMVGRYYD